MIITVIAVVAEKAPQKAYLVQGGYGELKSYEDYTDFVVKCIFLSRWHFEYYVAGEKQVKKIGMYLMDKC